MRRRITRARICRENKDWVYGYYFYDKEEYTWYFEVDGLGMLLVDNDTAGAYTLFRDKNGQKVFTKDIVRTPYTIWGDKGEYKGETDIIGVVVSPKDPLGEYEVVRENGSVAKIDVYDEDKVEVIGNIFDNPDIVPWYKS